MTDCVVFVANGMSRENARLQPWRYLYEIANTISMVDNCRAIIITEGSEDRDEECWGGDLYIVRTRFLSVRRQRELKDLIFGYAPRQLWWSVTPRSIAYWRLLREINCDKYALVTCPLYNYTQLIKATLFGVPFRELDALWRQRLVPRILFSILLRSRIFIKIFAQSEENLRILERMGVQKKKLVLLRVGIDAEDRASVSTEALDDVKREIGLNENDVVFLYFGAARKVRGFDALINAFARASGSDENARLIILARGADEGKLGEINARLALTGFADKVSVIGGWLSRELVWAYVQLCDVAVLPFIIVPSDVPIAILEAMARGKPVIGSNVDGIPELIEGRGVIVDPLDEKEFSGAILMLSQDSALRAKLAKNALEYMQHYPDWKIVGQMALDEAMLS